MVTYEVSNAGDVELTNVSVSDERDGGASCPKTALQPGETMTCTTSLLAVAGSHSIAAAAYGRPPCGELVQDEGSVHYRGRALTASLDLVKMTNGVHAEEPPGPAVPIGSTVQWTYAVTNTGSVALQSISVTDDGGVAVSCPKNALEPGESMTCTAAGVAGECQYSNTAEAEGHSARE